MLKVVGGNIRYSLRWIPERIRICRLNPNVFDAVYNREYGTAISNGLCEEVDDMRSNRFGPPGVRSRIRYPSQILGRNLLDAFLESIYQGSGFLRQTVLDCLIDIYLGNLEGEEDR